MDKFDIISWTTGSVLIPFLIAFGISAYFKFFSHTQQEKTWWANRKSMIWYSLSTIENETIHMKSAFHYLELQNIDISKEIEYFTFEDSGLVNHKRIQQQIDRLPPISIALGFMTHDQFTAITDYLGYGLGFIKSLEGGVYQGWSLKLREEKAREIFVLFQKEVQEFNGLKLWKEYFQSH